MLDVLQVLSLVLVALAMLPAVAHALELPGKLRLPRGARIRELRRAGNRDFFLDSRQRVS